MLLGIVVTTDGCLRQLRGLTFAAVDRGHRVRIFATDAGVRLLGDDGFTSLAALPGVAISFCSQSAAAHGGPPAGLPEAIADGSQFDNAVMAADSDKVILL